MNDHSLSLELLVSTMNNNYLKNSNFQNLPEQCRLTVINQHGPDYNESPARGVYNYQEKGLARSRNRALEKAQSTIGMLCDDDIQLVPDFYEIISKAYNELPDADIITFQFADSSGKLFTNYPEQITTHNTRSLLRVSSIEVTFKINSIKKAGLKFDERFGLGSTYKVGEENIFLNDAFKKGLKIYFYPKVIAIHDDECTGSIESPEMYYYRGAFFARQFPLTWPLMTSAYFVKNTLKDSPVSKIKMAQNLLKGTFNYLKS